MEIAFFGAAGEVTGSCARVDFGNGCFLVDCGLFQGGREAGQRNLQALDFDLSSIDFVLLSHAHLDHSGLVPRLVALGYRGRIFATAGTVDLLGIMLLDSAHIQEKEAEWTALSGHRKRRRHDGDGKPLYSVAQAVESLSSLERKDYGEVFSPHPAVRCRFHEAGHILGSAIIEIEIETRHGMRKLVFSGDLGQPLRPILRDPAHIDSADYLCIESTYGNRAHRPLHETEEELIRVLTDTLERRRGNVIIPAFAVGRTQEIVSVLADLVRSGRVPRLEVVVDSPMATAVSELTLKHEALWDFETRELLAWVRKHPERIGLRFVQDVEESIELNHVKSGLVIISASGMCDAGRIRHHLKYNIARSECSIVLCGFQAAGTLGRRLVDGAREVTLFGERLPVRAQVHTVGGLSAHADQPALLGWLGHFAAPPKRTFVVHGEHAASAELARAIRSRLSWREVTVPVPLTTYELE